MQVAQLLRKQPNCRHSDAATEYGSGRVAAEWRMGRWSHELCWCVEGRKEVEDAQLCMVYGLKQVVSCVSPAAVDAGGVDDE